MVRKCIIAKGDGKYIVIAWKNKWTAAQPTAQPNHF